MRVFRNSSSEINAESGGGRTYPAGTGGGIMSGGGDGGC